MTPRRLSFTLTLMILATLARAADNDPAWTKPFDGKSLAGWTNAAGKPVEAGKGWSVEDGMLVRSGHGGDIYTADEYADFDLKLEWKVTAGVNSGIKYRVKNYEPGGLLGPEYQIIDEVAWKETPIGSTASLYVIFPPSDARKLNATGEWNSTRIVCRGTKIEHWLNGVKVVEADTSTDAFKQAVAKSKFAKTKDFAQNKAGRIMLQDHAAEGAENKGKDVITFRNIEIRRIDTK